MAKDRSAHEAARGKKMVSLADLAKELPTGDDLVNYRDYILAESDRGAAVMAAALVEKALEDAIRSRMAAPDDKVVNSWFDGRNAPFRSFSAKISLGRALGVYGEKNERRLNLVKNIRNAFAHRMIPLDFSHPTLVAACRQLTPSPDDHHLEARTIFAWTCQALASMLGNDAVAKRGRETEVTFE